MKQVMMIKIDSPKWRMIDEYKVANPFIEVGFRQVKDVVDLRVFDLLNISRINNNRAEEMLLCIYHAMGLAEYAKATVEVHLRGLRYFLHFLYETGYIKQDFSAAVPKLCCGTGERIPHMLSTEQVNMLLDSIDRGNPIGKRNYAIIMMAACLGMRDSDITNLRFENIDWEKSTISFFQKKTNKFLVLPLLPVVGEAIIDYLRNGRPKTDSKYVFVKHRPPFEQATSFYMIMKTVLENSGIKLKANSSKGLHILRHSLASELIRQGESYNTVSTILGHASIGSTNAYTHIDVDGLFKCALELTEVTAHDR